MDLTRLTYLYRKYQRRQLTGAEREEWEAAVMDLSQDENIQHLIDPTWQEAAQFDAVVDVEESERIYRYIVGQAQRKKPRARIHYLLRYAAAAIVICSIGFLLLPDGADKPQQHVIQADILPGGNKAILAFADGRTVDLDSAHSGIVIGDQITYENGEVVAYAERGELAADNLQLVTPKGGVYQVTLADGTKVWLNAASTLKYPLRFPDGKREVFLAGEAYFEVTKDSAHPFLVSTPEQGVEVLGTQFNVTAYPDELSTKTTLVEGRVRISNTKSGTVHDLNPGQQGIANGPDTQVKNVSISQFTAWKDGYFSFDETPFPEVLEQLARWYDINITYLNVPRKTFSGKMKRDAQLSSVLDFIEGAGIQFRVEGRKLIII